MAIDLLAVLRLDDQMTSSLKSAAGAATVGFAAITAAAAVTVNEFSKFDTAIRKTGAIAGANAQELEALKNSALDLGQSTSKSATEVANSMTELAASGMNASNVMKAMPGIISASEASGESLAVAAETVAGALNIWSLEAEKSTHVADVLAMTANVSAAGITDLGYAFKYAGAPAAALGVTLEETAAAIGIMSNANIDGSSAGTALRASLLALNNPATAQAKMMKQLGFSATDAAGEFKSLSTMIGDMQKATEHMTEADKVATLGKLVGTEAVSGFLALIKAGPAEINKMTDALVNSDGAATETASQMMAGIGGAVEEMMGTMNSVAILIGEKLAPTVVSFARIVSSINFTPFIDAIGVVGGAAAHVAKLIEDNWSTIGPILKPIVTVLAAMAGSFMLIGGAGAIFMALSTAIGFISGPIAAVALGIGAVVGGLALLYDKVAPFRNKVTSMFDGLKVALGFEVNMPQAPKMAGDTGAMMLDEGNQAPQSVEYLSIAEQITKAFEKVKTAVAPVLTEVSNAFTQFKEFGGVAIDFLKAKFTEIQPSLAPLAGIFAQVWGTVSSVLTSAWSIISPILGGLWDLLQIVGEYSVIMFNNVLVPALGLAAQAFSTVWSVASPILTGLALAFEVWMAVVKAVWENALAPFVNFLTTGVKNAFESLSEGLGEIAGAFDWVSDKVGLVYDKIRDFATMISNVKLPDWVTSGVSTVVKTVGKFIGSDKEVDGSHKTGLWSVPWDNYLAQLHVGETVLPRDEADAYRALVGKGGSLGGVSGVDNVSYEGASAGITNNNNTYATYMSQERPKQQQPATQAPTKMGDIIIQHMEVRNDSDIPKIAQELLFRMKEVY